MAIDLSKLKASKTPKPPRITVHGGEGIGKSTFFSKFPSPVFIQTEEGLNELEVVKLPQKRLAESYEEVMEFIKELYTQKHDFKTVVIDSADWMERLCWKYVCKERGETSIEDFGYARGYVFSADAFLKLLEGLNALRLERGMIVGLTAHSQVKRFDDPSTEPYDRYLLKLNKHTASILSEWSDIIGYASKRVIVESEDVGFNKKARRGVGVGDHLLWLQERPAFVAKNRYNLPESIPLQWSALEEGISESLNSVEF